MAYLRSSDLIHSQNPKSVTLYQPLNSSATPQPLAITLLTPCFYESEFYFFKIPHISVSGNFFNILMLHSYNLIILKDCSVLYLEVK